MTTPEIACQILALFLQLVGEQETRRSRVRYCRPDLRRGFAFSPAAGKKMRMPKMGFIILRIFRTMTLLNIPGFSVQVIDVKRSRRQRFRAHCLWFWDDSVKGRTRAKCSSLVVPRAHLCQTPECSFKGNQKSESDMDYSSTYLCILNKSIRDYPR